MQSDVKANPTKVTYATMSGDQMEGLHRELDAAIERVKQDFGKVHPMLIGGNWVKGPGEFEDRSPIDTRILIGRFYNATREQAQAMGYTVVDPGTVVATPIDTVTRGRRVMKLLAFLAHRAPGEERRRGQS